MPHTNVASKIDLAPHGYAPGSGLFYCIDCNADSPEVGHKHSSRCATHALRAKRVTELMGINDDLEDAIPAPSVMPMPGRAWTVLALAALCWLGIGLGIKALI